MTPQIEHLKTVIKAKQRLVEVIDANPKSERYTTDDRQDLVEEIDRLKIKLANLILN